jgi:hypothetical protein
MFPVPFNEISKAEPDGADALLESPAVFGNVVGGDQAVNL